MPIPQLTGKSPRWTEGSDHLEGERHFRGNDMRVGLKHDDLAVAGQNRESVAAIVRNHQVDFMLSDGTEVPEEDIFALGRIRIMDRIARNLGNDTVGRNEDLVDQAKIEFLQQELEIGEIEDLFNEVAHFHFPLRLHEGDRDQRIIQEKSPLLKEERG